MKFAERVVKQGRQTSLESLQPHDSCLGITCKIKEIGFLKHIQNNFVHGQDEKMTFFPKRTVKRAYFYILLNCKSIDVQFSFIAILFISHLFIYSFTSSYIFDFCSYFINIEVKFQVQLKHFAPDFHSLSIEIMRSPKHNQSILKRIKRPQCTVDYIHKALKQTAFTRHI